MQRDLARDAVTLIKGRRTASERSADRPRILLMTEPCDLPTAISTPHPGRRTTSRGYDAGIGLRRTSSPRKVKASTRRGMSTAVIPLVPHTFSPVLLRALVPVLVILMSGGCVGLSDNPESVGDGGEGEGENTGDNSAEFFGAVCASPVINDDNGTVCGGCEFGNGDICGVADVAICEARENSDGQACELCLTAAGIVLYDDCFRTVVDTAACEVSPGVSDDVVCRTCFDEVGNAVSSSCTPVADRCDRDVEIGGRLCNQCYRDDVLVSTVCAPTDLTPRHCMAYDNDVGRCVDCYDANDALIAHDCSPASDGAACEERIQGGLLCTVCTDNIGQVASQECRDELPERARCERLEFSEQRCVMCAGIEGDVTFVKCDDVACTDGNVFCRDDSGCDEGEVCFDGLCVGSGSSDAEGKPAVDACVEPPRCVISHDVDGDLCRTCLTSAGATETLCMSTSNLTCAAVDEALLPDVVENVVDELFTDAPESSAGRAQGRSCVVCTDSAVDAEVYRDCAVPPPYCLDTSTIDGDLCSVCYDAVTSAVVYSACANDTCYDQRDVALHDDDGVAVLVDRATAIVGCKQCSAGDVDFTSCALRGRCDDGLTADADSCETTATTTLRLQPHRCSNPWTAWRNSTDRADDLAGLMSWALSEHGLVIDAATTTPGDTSCAVDACSCARGDVVTIVISAGDTALAESAFAGFLAP